VAIVGLLGNKQVGNYIFRNNVKLGYSGRIYPVNPGAVRLRASVPSVAAIPENVELAVIAVPAHLVLESQGTVRGRR
jgi:acyl-CoA synthetase (NDP forming)